MGISRRAYAQLRGVNESSVRRAIQSGRITPEPDGTIDPAKADAEWGANTDPAKQRGAAASAASPKGSAQLIAEVLAKPASSSNGRPDPNTPVQPREGAMNLNAARTANEVLKAKLADLKLKQQKNMLVDREKAKALVFDLARRERDAWQNWPPRVAANMAAELDVDPHLLETVLDRYLREHLEQLAGVKVDVI
mgnify:CR=1 FL=1